MGRKTKFNQSWISGGKLDENGDDISNWCKPCDDYSAFCTVCNKSFSVASMGFSQINSHASSAKHKQLLKCKKNQLTFEKQENDGGESSLKLTSTSKGKMWLPSNIKEKGLKFEILLLLQAIKCNYPFANLGSLVEICAESLDDSTIVKNVTLSETKARYVTKFGLAPFFRKTVFQDIGKSFFTLYFDETTTRQSKKQLDIHISYWSEKFEKIVTSYCESEFVGHLEASKIFEIVTEFIDNNNLSIDKCLQFSLDGPNVNLSFLKKFNCHLDFLNHSNLIDIGTCPLHILNNALKKGLSKLDCDVESLIVDVFLFLRMSAARKEDFHNIQIDVLFGNEADHEILKHVSSRWLTLAPACDRFIEQYPALTEYFLDFLVKNNNVSKLGERYRNICTFLKDPMTLVYLHFTSFFASCFLPYSLLLQKNTPLIHILYSKLNELVRNIMFKFMKQDIVNEKEGLSLKNVDCRNSKSWVTPRNTINIGSGALNLLNSDFNKPEHKQFFLSVRSCYMEACEYLQNKLPISNVILRDVQCIHPTLRDQAFSKVAVNRLVQHLIKITKTNYICDVINTEWCMYACEKFANTYEKDQDICKYWSDVSKIKDAAGIQKYPNLSAFVKNCLTLSHGNAVPERGFSINNTIVTSSKASISELGIRSLRLIKDYIYRYKRVKDIPLTKDLIESVQKSHSAYASHLEELKQKANLQVQMKRKLEEKNEENAKKQKRKDEMNAKLAELTETENSLIGEETAAHCLLKEANERLKLAISKSDMKDIKVAQMMVDAASESITTISKKLTTVRHNIAELKK